MVSLGCPKNLVDSETILGRAGAAGLEICADPTRSDIVVVNTCSFIDSAKEESVQAILEACELKKRGGDGPRKVVVTGCLAQRYGEDLRREVPEVDAIIGLGQYDGIGEALLELLGEERPRFQVASPDFACNAETGRLRLTPRHFAYLRISEGCDNPCTFCAIPAIRGRFRSKPVAEVEKEARELVASGARELVLISQDTTSYGVDLDGRFQLPKLLERLAGVPGLRWIRLLYVYPTSFSSEMIDAVASIPQVLKYIDIPLQHIADDMLRRMGRRSNEAKTRELLASLRARIPGLTLRTTFIVGFPGEEPRHFEALKDFVREVEFERLGVFCYSHEDGTPAFRMKDLVEPELARERRAELMELQQGIAFQHNRRRKGSEVEALVDGQDGKAWIARSAAEAPEIDPVIRIPDRRGEHGRGGLRTDPASGLRELTVIESPARFAPYRQLGLGRFVKLRITGSRGYDLLAEPIEG